MVRNKAALRVFFVLLLILISLSGIFSRSLWKPDEPRVAEIGREMWMNHQYTVPTLNKTPFLEKPPLYWWVMSASYELFGVSDGNARLPSALFGFLTLLFTYLIGRRIGGEKTGMFAALILATLTEFSIISHRCLVDNALIFFVTFGYYGFFTAYDSKTSRGKWIGYELMAITSGLAFLSKGLVGPALIVGPPVLVLLVYRDLKEFRRIMPHIGIGIILFLIIVAPWIIGLYLVGGNHALREHLLQNTLGRMLPPAISHYVGGHRHSFLYYFRKLPQDFIPWIIALPATIAFLIHHPQSIEKRVYKGLTTVLLLFAGGFLFLSLPETKRGLYLVPIYPLLAISIGGWLAFTCGRQSTATTLEKWTLLILLGAFAAIPLGIAIGSIIIVLTGLGPRGIQMAPVIRHLTSLLVLIVPFGILAFLFLGSKFIKALKDRTLPSCGIILATAVVFVFVYHEGAVRIMDPVKSIRRFPDKASPYILKDKNIPLVGYKLDELTRGMIPFYTGRYINDFYRISHLIRFFQSHPEVLLIIPDQEVKKLPLSLKNHIVPLTEQTYSCRFKIQLFRFKFITGNPRASPGSPNFGIDKLHPGKGI
jgi:4-amino-4-deoxy-L-arabinose transferase-like glycosyltransferase